VYVEGRPALGDALGRPIETKGVAARVMFTLATLLVVVAPALPPLPAFPPLLPPDEDEDPVASPTPAVTVVA